MEGVFAQPRSTHPFRIIENDAISIQSMTSLGRVGRILAGTADASNSTVEKDTYSTNASIQDWNAVSASTSTSNATSTTADVYCDRKIKSAPNSSISNVNNFSTSSNDNTNNPMTLQGKFSSSFYFLWFVSF